MSADTPVKTGDKPAVPDRDGCILCAYIAGGGCPHHPRPAS
jgi:hypothetical protein